MPAQPDPEPLRVAILETGLPLPQTQAKYGTYGPVFSALFSAAAAPVPLANLLTLTYHDVVSGDPATVYPSLDAIDGILITGSKFSAYDPDPWIARLIAYTRAALDRRPAAVRVIGVCFGHQIVAAALGLPVRPNPAGWEVSVTPVQLTPRGDEVFFSRKTARNEEQKQQQQQQQPPPPSAGESEARLGSYRSLRLHQMHRDEVVGLPDGAEPLGATDLCVTQGFLLPGRALTVQGHPEFTAEIVREILVARNEIGIIGDDVYKSGMERVDRAHDGVEAARAFLRFLMD